MVTKEEVLDKGKRRDSFKLNKKSENSKPEIFPGNSVEEDEERIKRFFSEIEKSGTDVKFWERATPSRFRFN